MTNSRKLIAFSLYGADKTYTEGAIENVIAYSELLPEYTCVFFCGPSVPGKTKTYLLALGAEVREIQGREDWGATMWRFLILHDWESFDRVIFRDCDSRPSESEIAAVRAWEESDAELHAMRAHPAHGAALLAGLWGCTAEVAADVSRRLPLLSQIRMSNDYHEHIDQGWLEQHVWSVWSARALVHASHWKTFYGPTVPFPVDPTFENYPGRAFDENGVSRYADTYDCSTCGGCTIRCPQ